MAPYRVHVQTVRALLVVLVAVFVSAEPRGAASDVLPFKATERTLPNGLKVIVVPTGFPNLVSIEIPVQTGSRNEVEPGKSGFAHFFEHLMFRGTPKTPPEKYREIMSKAGARDNASTGDDRTHYYATFAKEHLEPVLATLRRHVPAPGVFGGGLQDRGARDPRRIQQEQRRAAREAVRGAARTRSTRRTPTSTRRWASSTTSRTCRTSTRTRSCSSSAGTGRSTRRSSSPAT